MVLIWYVKNNWETYKNQETSIKVSRDIMVYLNSCNQIVLPTITIWFDHRAYPYKLMNYNMTNEDLFNRKIPEYVLNYSNFYNEISHQMGWDFIVQCFCHDYRNVSIINK